jgi:hypothetical protein
VGTTVTLTGTGFTGATTVELVHAEASFIVISDVRITLTVPAVALSGRISVTTPGGTGTSVAAFTVVPAAPTITLKLSGLTAGVMRLGHIVTATGAVTPLSLVGSRVVLSVQVKIGGTWVKVKTTSASISPKGKYSWKYAPAERGSYRMRAQITATEDYPAATTTWRTFIVT